MKKINGQKVTTQKLKGLEEELKNLKEEKEKCNNKDINNNKDKNEINNMKKRRKN